MSNKIVKSAVFNQRLQASLNTEPDYSEAFTAEVASLAHAVEDAVSAPVEHDDDMNYSAGQKIVVWLDEACRPVVPQDRHAAYRLITYIGSRGPYFTFVALRLAGGSAMNGRKKGVKSYWISAAQDDCPDQLKLLQRRIGAVMEATRYTRLEGPVLSRLVEGRVTELDGKPATVFEVLFSETI